ncbi:hypothetical protein C8F04DRAFT_1030023 [Mycena alexandri]|uniref:Uncharacterized protein n=1 Tax=Mycena alexandri TaxID=1745969 RepID=A0AAD6TA98_9AGAR|nr:hypothetical protein C8F04DRAFT_1030023 [Mycena alexandri]
MAQEDHLPAFLVPFGQYTKAGPHEGVFNHPNLGPAHSVWWNSEGPPDAVFLFIPGNPGLVQFYAEFLGLLRSEHPHLAIFAHAHLGHTPSIFSHKHSLATQVESAIQALDAVHTMFPAAKIVLSGHSVGSWIALQVLKARPSDISQVFLLCPTITHIADTPNGRRLSWSFRSPLPRLVAWLSYLTRPLPLSLLFPWPVLQIAVLRSLLNSPATIFACLSMAHEEMATIRELDSTLLEEHKHQIYLYFAAQDDWVSTYQAKITRLFLPNDASRVEQADVPHAFCLRRYNLILATCSSPLS